MFTVLEEIAKMSPYLALLVAIVVYLIKKENGYRRELKEERESNDIKIESLNNELRDTEKSNLDMINKLADALEKMSITNKNVHHDIENLKREILEKLNDIRYGR